MRVVLILFGYMAAALGQSLHFPCPEKLTYDVEWRLISAGTATVLLARDAPRNGWNFNLNIVSAGLVSRLYRVADSYTINTSDRFCLDHATLDAQEGKKHLLSKLTVDQARNKLAFEQHDLIKNGVEQKTLDVAPCTYDIVGALASIRMLNLEPGRSVALPITDGKKFVHAKVTALSKEKITVSGQSYDTTRYEAFLFDNVLYRRHGRLQIWVSNDADHVPVQLRMMFGFPIGTVTVSLKKQEH